MLKCRDIERHASQFLARDLPFSVRIQFRLHLFICKNCQRFVNQFHLTIETLKKLPQHDEATPSGIASHAELLQAFRNHYPTHKPPPERLE